MVSSLGVSLVLGTSKIFYLTLILSFLVIVSFSIHILLSFLITFHVITFHFFPIPIPIPSHLLIFNLIFLNYFVFQPKFSTFITSFTPRGNPYFLFQIPYFSDH